MDEHLQGDQEQNQSSTTPLVRFLWMVVGVIVMAFSTAFILRRDALDLADLLYWMAVAVMAAARVVDVIYLKGETVEGRPATVGDLRRYLILMPLAAIVIWLAAHAVARARWME